MALLILCIKIFGRRQVRITRSKENVITIHYTNETTNSNNTHTIINGYISVGKLTNVSLSRIKIHNMEYLSTKNGRLFNDISYIESIFDKLKFMQI